MANSTFNFKSFLEDSKQVLIAPKEYFASMPKEGGMAEPLIKAVIYSVVAALINFIWFTFVFTSSFGAATGGFLAGGVGFFGILMSIIGSILALFIGGVIVLVLSAISGGETKYESNVRVVAATMVLSPISALLGFTSQINIWLGLIVSILITLYGIFMVYHALVQSLGAKQGAAKVVAGILCLIPAFMILSTFMCYQGAKKVESELGKELMKGMNSKEAQEFQKKLNEAMKKAAEQK